MEPNQHFQNKEGSVCEDNEDVVWFGSLVSGKLVATTEREKKFKSIDICGASSPMNWVQEEFT